jgi:hypothetical protein
MITCLGGLQSSKTDAQGNQGLFGQNQGGNFGGGNLGGGDNGVGGNQQGNGGGSIADFQSLVDLIQTTVVPDTWDALGGPSTMREYPQGVYVDPSGTLVENASIAGSDGLVNLTASLAITDDSDSSARNWLAPAQMRCVSLKRLSSAVAFRSERLLPPTETMVHLAGLSKIDYVFFTRDEINGDDIVIAGPVAGVESHQGWVRDRQSGRATLRLDFLAAAFQSARTQTPFGCTIDPTREGLQNAAAVAAQIQAKQIPIGKGAKSLADAIGMQRVEVFGTPPGTAMGLMMVEADRHMKQLALGVHPLPETCINYLDAIDRNIAAGPPNDLLLRLWFTAKPKSIQSDPDKTVFRLTGDAIRLSGQNERAKANGDRGHVIGDPRTALFVEDFNGHWGDIRARYPVYAGLESIYEAAAVAAVADRFGDSERHHNLIESIAAMSSLASSSLAAAGTSSRAAQQVETIAVLHQSRSGRKRHSIVIASGGVMIRPQHTVSVNYLEDPALRSYQDIPDDQPKVIHHWWWDAK